MSEIVEKDYTRFNIPPSIISKKDISLLISEAEAIDASLTANDVKERSGIEGGDNYDTTDQMEEFISTNDIDMSNGSKRFELIKQLRELKDSAPVIHLTFATSADYDSLSQIVDWLRQNIEKQAVITVGLQPALVGGVHIRTTNQVHDLSLRKQLEKHRDVLIKEVESYSVAN